MVPGGVLEEELHFLDCIFLQLHLSKRNIVGHIFEGEKVPVQEEIWKLIAFLAIYHCSELLDCMLFFAVFLDQ